jgi:hypothetical protein
MDVSLCASAADLIFPVFAILSLMFNHNSPFFDIVQAESGPSFAATIARTAPVVLVPEIAKSLPCSLVLLNTGEHPPGRTVSIELE